MSTTSASSLIPLSLKPKTLSLSNSGPNSLTLFSFSHKLHAKPLSCSAAIQSFELLTKKSSFSSKFVRHVYVPSEYGQEEDLFGSDDDGDVEEVETPRFSENLKLFVGNLPFSVDSAQLADLFGSAGNVQMVEVIYDKETGRSRGFAFVTMSTVEEVETVAQQFNGYELDGRALRVNSGPPPPRRDDFAPRGGRDFSSRGGRDFSSRGGRDFSSRGGRDFSSRGGRDFSSRGGRDFSSRGRDFDSRGGRDFSSRGGRDFSYRGGGREFSSRGGEREFSSRGGERGGPSMGDGNRVYVGNLSWGVDDSTLENLFSEQGRVVDAKVVYDRESGRSRGFGFVTYSSSEEVDSAVRSLNGCDLDGRPIRVTVAESKPRREF